MVLSNKEDIEKSAPISATFWTFTDTGVPRLVIRFSADTLIHASGLCCGNARLHGVAENALVASHCKLGMVAQVVARDALPSEVTLLRNDLNMAVALRVVST
ncbi:hypothetical protein [Caballeronia sp. 15711]|uniref:hypothetical protein n=1 Tax=Caballeronia sp. 15711 TaxID=3391029 RepID=UPI0039E47BA2